MILGFKTGPKSIEEGKRIVKEDGARMCEVWFNILEADSYLSLFEWMSAHHVLIGLHHWGMAQGKYKTNLAAKDDAIRFESINQIKQTIDIAADIDAVYVNAHPGARMAEMLNLETWAEQPLPETELEDVVAKDRFLSAANDLLAYAEDKNILLTIETLPGAEIASGGDRTNIYIPGNASLNWLEEMCQQGGTLANDITHTLGMIALTEQHPDAIWEQFMEFTRRVASSTRLLHVNTVHPPLNGTDSHNGITDIDFAGDVFPDKERMKEWLRVFYNCDNVYAVLEPKSNTMQENYRALVRLAEEL